MTYQTNIKNLLVKSDGLAIGEEHWTTAIPNFLIDNLPLFQEQNVKTIYTELVAAGNDKFVQNYYSNPTDENLEKIRPVLQDPANKNEVLQLIKTAQQLGIRIVGIDQQPRPEQWDELEGKLKDHPYGHMITNQYWAEQVTTDRSSKPEGKFIVHGGSLHMRGMAGMPHIPSDYEPKDTLPKLLGIPFITIETDSPLRPLNLKGNDINASKPEDSRVGQLNIVLSPAYKAEKNCQGITPVLDMSLQP